MKLFSANVGEQVNHLPTQESDLLTFDTDEETTIQRMVADGIKEVLGNQGLIQQNLDHLQVNVDTGKQGQAILAAIIEDLVRNVKYLSASILTTMSTIRTWIIKAEADVKESNERTIMLNKEMKLYIDQVSSMLSEKALLILLGIV